LPGSLDPGFTPFAWRTGVTSPRQFAGAEHCCKSGFLSESLLAPQNDMALGLSPSETWENPVHSLSTYFSLAPPTQPRAPDATDSVLGIPAFPAILVADVSKLKPGSKSS